MTNLAAIHTDFRAIGDTTLAVYELEFRRKNSPMLATARATFEAAKPMSALFLAQCGFENQYKTTGKVIRPGDNNPAALRPWPEDPRATKDADVLDWKTRKKVGTMKVPPYAAGAIRASDGTYMLRFPSDADCAREYRYRLQAGSSYKNGIYNRAKTLEQMLAIYAPAGDVHPVTGLDNADADYLGTVTDLLTSYKNMEGTMPDANDIAIDLTDVLLDIVKGVGKGPSPHGVDALDPDTEVVPAVVILALEVAPDDQLVIRWGRDMFFRVERNMVAVRTTPRYQRAVLGGPITGAPMDAGDVAFIEWAWITYDGHLWLMSDWDTRFFGADFLILDTLEPLPVPDPGPAIPKPQEPEPPVVAPGLPAFMTVEDPWTLLPPIEWVGSPNFFPNRSGFGKPIAMVDHITDDMSLSNVLGWFKNPASDASSHFVIDRNGKVYQMVSSADGAFTNGKVDRPRTDIPVILDVVRRGINFNNATITIEHVGTPKNPPTPAQYESSRKIHQYFSHPKVYGINRNRSHQLRHGDIDSVDRPYCPGDDFDLAGTIRALGGDPAKLA